MILISKTREAIDEKKKRINELNKEIEYEKLLEQYVKTNSIIKKHLKIKHLMILLLKE